MRSANFELEVAYGCLRVLRARPLVLKLHGKGSNLRVGLQCARDSSSMLLLRSRTSNASCLHSAPRCVELHRELTVGGIQPCKLIMMVSSIWVRLGLRATQPENGVVQISSLPPSEWFRHAWAKPSSSATPRDWLGLSTDH